MSSQMKYIPKLCGPTENVIQIRVVPIACYICLLCFPLPIWDPNSNNSSNTYVVYVSPCIFGIQIYTTPVLHMSRLFPLANLGSKFKQHACHRL